jgi:hypothetical protein
MIAEVAQIAEESSTRKGRRAKNGEPYLGINVFIR